jgi:ElaB/YqjD/DUF883 family membrane-anchored ribosome-binding protein
MDDEPEVIRRQMEETRSDLTRKIEALEHHVVETVYSTTSAVTNTVSNVKEAVQETVSAVKGTVSDTVESVRETLDLRHHVAEHPWLMFGASVAAGYVSGLLLGGGRGRAQADRMTDLRSHGQTFFAPPPSSNGGAGDRGALEADARRSSFTVSPAHRPDELGWLGELGKQFAPEIGKLKGVALGALGALVRDLVTRSVAPQLGPQLSDLVDDVTRKLGGEPVRGSLFQSGPADGQYAGKTSRERDTFTEAHKPRAASSL